ncbi:MAG: rhomboid family intramembrane serine protease [Chloroflexi bacterium]|nr:rhomboid family intramembrane serine protease [Chloroflexota bacterium]
MNEIFSERPPQEEPVPQPQTARVAMPSLTPIATYMILGFTALVYLLQLASAALLGDDLPLLLGARVTELILEGQWWRFLTPVFLHGSAAHIFFNMYALLSIGSFLERHLGRGRFLLLYFLSAFAGNVFSFLLTEGYSVGASTAVFGLIAAEAVFFYQNRKLFGAQAKQALGNVLFIVIVNLFIGLSPGIDNWGHVGGLLGGAMFSWFAGPLWKVAGIFPNFHLEDQRELREVVMGASVTILVFGALAAAGLF